MAIGVALGALLPLSYLIQGGKALATNTSGISPKPTLQLTLRLYKRGSYFRVSLVSAKRTR